MEECGRRTRYLVLVVLLIVLAGCTSNPGNSVTASATPSSPDILTTPISANKDGSQPSATPPAKATLESNPSPTIVNGPVMTQTEGSLVVEIYSDSDVVVTTASYTLTGNAPVGTVVSANDQIAVVDKSLTFSIEVPLDDGTNLINVLASDWSGNEVSFLITVTYIA